MQQWRSLEELALEADALASPDSTLRSPEFPVTPRSTGGRNRRDALKAMAGSLTLAGLAAACSAQPEERALPFIEAPEYQPPGQHIRYASAMTLDGYAVPLLVETHMGRPIKLEGNPDHPLTQGGTDPFVQALVLGLYDPDRSSAVTYRGRIASWPRFQRAMVETMRRYEQRQGRGLAILTGTITSPSTVRQLKALQGRLPALRLYHHEPVGEAFRPRATQAAFGRTCALRYRLERADIVVSFEEDLLGPGPAQIAHARGWSAARTRLRDAGRAATLHAIESTPSLTGASATGVFALSVDEMTLALVRLAGMLGVETDSASSLPARIESDLATVAAELKAAGGSALVAVGAHLPPEVQALAFAINERLTSLGRTIEVIEPPYWRPEDLGDLVALVEAIDEGVIETLLILESNPVYTAPADLFFASRMQQVPLRVHVGLEADETAGHCHWHVASTHPLETWSDARAVCGTAGVIQPIVKPLFGGHTIHEVLSSFDGRLNESAYEVVRTTWREILGEDGFESRWRELLERGFAPETTARTLDVQTRNVRLTLPEPQPDELSVVFRPDPSIWDGRFANNAWLQELPRPLSKIVWDNVASISPELASERGIESGDELRLLVGDQALTAAAWILPGQAARTIGLTLGYGREAVGRFGFGVGYNAYTLRQHGALWHLGGVVLETTGERLELASTQRHHEMHGHDFVRTMTPNELASSEPIQEEVELPSLYPRWDYPTQKWGMVIDLDLCIGCNACVVACQSENNIPVVGKDQVAQGREMHWLRIDLYHEGERARPTRHFQPVPCMHCEKAPCEMGCPVNATVHGPEGLNQMVYNRCVGTRTCASYCPYKVRRFNFLDYTGENDEAMLPQRNPDVTVRMRGVVEKCTYCVQRISTARINGKIAGKPIEDGAVETACQGACPSSAIHFGDLNSETSRVRWASRSPRAYALLNELGTRPRTRYLAKVALKNETG